MKKLIWSLSLFLLSHPFLCFSQSTISLSSVSPVSFCNVSTNLTIDITTTGPFYGLNFFYVELSDASGSFTSPTILGQSKLNQQVVSVAAGLSASTAYQLEVRSSYPVAMSDTMNISILQGPSGSFDTLPPAMCGPGESPAFNITSASSAGFWHSPNGAGFFTNAMNKQSSYVSVAEDCGKQVILQWNIISLSCGNIIVSDTIQVNCTSQLEAGSDVFLCGSDSAIMQAALPLGGTGVWRQINFPGPILIVDSTDAHTEVKFLFPGLTYQLEWSATDGVCSHVDTLTITVADSLMPAQAGNDRTICGVTSTALDATPLSQGSGQWRQVSGPAAATIMEATNPQSGISGLVDGDYQFEWTVSGGSCATTVDTVALSIIATVAIADAGPDINICGESMVTLQAKSASAGSGQWLQISGALANITDLNDPHTTVTGLQPGTYSYEWIVTHGLCSTTMDTVVLQVNDSPSPAYAGQDQLLCNVSSTTLHATVPTVGIGKWEQVSGTTVTITDVNSPSTTVNGLANGIYKFKWQTSNSVCLSPRDTIVIMVSAGSPSVILVDPILPSYCVGGSVPITVSGTHTYSWSPSTGLSATFGSSVVASPTATTTYFVTATDTITGCAVVKEIEVKVNVPDSVTITQQQFTLIASDGESFQWLLDGNIINGATERLHVALTNGNYTVNVTDKNGCKRTSEVFSYTKSRNRKLEATALRLYPNPAKDYIRISLNETAGAVRQDWSLQLSDMTGKNIPISAYRKSMNSNEIEISVSSLPPGMYILQIEYEDGRIQYGRFVRTGQ